MLALRTVTGPEIGPYLADLADLRIRVFREFPYLYDGDLAYEHEYLAAYAKSPDSVFVLALDAGKVVGAATGVPLSDEGAVYQRPFVAKGMAVEEVFYFGESVLLPAYRGKRIGHQFFDEREKHARNLGRFRWTGFCAVIRANDHPERPFDYRPHDVFWRKRGYVAQPGMCVQLSWKDLGAGDATEKPLMVWLRSLERRDGGDRR